MIKLFSLSIVCLLMMSIANAQTAADPQLLDEILKIKAIDNHAHPLRLTLQGEKPDDEYDALPLESIEAFSLPVRLNLSNPEYIGAWKELFSYEHKDMSETHVGDLVSTK